jgi:hypothetical protein
MGVGSGVGSVHKVLGEYAARRERSGGTSVVTVCQSSPRWGVTFGRASAQRRSHAGGGSHSTCLNDNVCVRKAGYKPKNICKTQKKPPAHTSRPRNGQRKKHKTRHITSHMTMRTAMADAHTTVGDVGRRIMVLVTVSRSEREAPTGYCDANISTSGHFNK